MGQLWECNMVAWYAGGAYGSYGTQDEVYHSSDQGSLYLLDRVILWSRLFSLSDEKLYDAYVLYPKCPRKSQGHDVETLVLKILPEVLEKQCGYKLFIFGRDEFPGQGMF